MKRGTAKREKRERTERVQRLEVPDEFRLLEAAYNLRNERVKSGKDDLEYVGEEFGSDGSLTPDQEHSQRSSSQSIDETSIETCFEDRKRGGKMSTIDQRTSLEACESIYSPIEPTQMKAEQSPPTKTIGALPMTGFLLIKSSK